MKITHHAEYYYPGSFVSESESKQLDARSVEQAMAKIDPGAFGFVLYDLETKSGTLEDGETITKATRVNKSGMFYPGAVIFNLPQVKEMGRDFSILASNMEANKWPVVVKTRRGNYQPFNNGDVLL